MKRKFHPSTVYEPSHKVKTKKHPSIKMTVHSHKVEINKISMFENVTRKRKVPGRGEDKEWFI